MTEDISMREVLANAILKDRAAQQVLFFEYYDLIAAVARQTLPEDLRTVISQDDLVQDIVARLISKLETFDLERWVEFPGWLKQVARSEVLDQVSHWRAYGGLRVPASPVAPTASGTGFMAKVPGRHSAPSATARREEERAALEAAMAKLPDDQSEAIRRKYFMEQNHAEIAMAMNRTCGAVRELLRRAETKLEADMGRPSEWLSSR